MAANYRLPAVEDLCAHVENYVQQGQESPLWAKLVKFYVIGQTEEVRERLNEENGASELVNGLATLLQRCLDAWGADLGNDTVAFTTALLSTIVTRHSRRTVPAIVFTFSTTSTSQPNDSELKHELLGSLAEQVEYFLDTAVELVGAIASAPPHSGSQQCLKIVVKQCVSTAANLVLLCADEPWDQLLGFFSSAAKKHGKVIAASVFPLLICEFLNSVKDRRFNMPSMKRSLLRMELQKNAHSIMAACAEHTGDSRSVSSDDFCGATPSTLLQSVVSFLCTAVTSSAQDLCPEFFMNVTNSAPFQATCDLAADPSQRGSFEAALTLCALCESIVFIDDDMDDGGARRVIERCLQFVHHAAPHEHAMRVFGAICEGCGPSLLTMDENDPLATQFVETLQLLVSAIAVDPSNGTSSVQDEDTFKEMCSVLMLLVRALKPQPIPEPESDDDQDDFADFVETVMEDNSKLTYATRQIQHILAEAIRNVAENTIASVHWMMQGSDGESNVCDAIEETMDLVGTGLKARTAQPTWVAPFLKPFFNETFNSFLNAAVSSGGPSGADDLLHICGDASPLPTRHVHDEYQLDFDATIAMAHCTLQEIADQLFRANAEFMCGTVLPQMHDVVGGILFREYSCANANDLIVDSLRRSYAYIVADALSMATLLLAPNQEGGTSPFVDSLTALPCEAGTSSSEKAVMPPATRCLLNSALFFVAHATVDHNPSDATGDGGNNNVGDDFGSKKTPKRKEENFFWDVLETTSGGDLSPNEGCEAIIGGSLMATVMSIFQNGTGWFGCGANALQENGLIAGCVLQIAGTLLQYRMLLSKKVGNLSNACSMLRFIVDGKFLESIVSVLPQAAASSVFSICISDVMDDILTASHICRSAGSFWLSVASLVGFCVPEIAGGTQLMESLLTLCGLTETVQMIAQTLQTGSGDQVSNMHSTRAVSLSVWFEVALTAILIQTSVLEVASGRGFNLSEQVIGAVDPLFSESVFIPYLKGLSMLAAPHNAEGLVNHVKANSVGNGGGGTFTGGDAIAFTDAVGDALVFLVLILSKETNGFSDTRLVANGFIQHLRSSDHSPVATVLPSRAMGFLIQRTVPATYSAMGTNGVGELIGAFIGAIGAGSSNNALSSLEMAALIHSLEKALDNSLLGGPQGAYVVAGCALPLVEGALVAITDGSLCSDGMTISLAVAIMRLWRHFVASGVVLSNDCSQQSLFDATTINFVGFVVQDPAFAATVKGRLTLSSNSTGSSSNGEENDEDGAGNDSETGDRASRSLGKMLIAVRDQDHSNSNDAASTFINAVANAVLHANPDANTAAGGVEAAVERLMQAEDARDAAEGFLDLITLGVV